MRISAARDAGFVFPNAVKLQRQGDVFQSRERGDQVEGLKDESDAAAAEQGPLVVAEARVVDALEQDLSGGRRFDGAENRQQSALAGAGGTNDREQLALADDEVDTADGVDGDFTLSVRLLDVDGFNDFHELPPVVHLRRMGGGESEGWTLN